MSSEIEWNRKCPNSEIKLQKINLKIYDQIR